ncbi:MAG: type III-B CRISPR module-associated protein Cmr5 [Candidatus Binatia bacterium]
MSQQRSLEQKRAAQAWECVTAIKGKPYEKDYSSLARSAPADIQSNGLGQTLAFWRAKGYDKGKPKDNGHAQLLSHVSGWIRDQQKEIGSKDMLEWIAKESATDQYRRATAEAMAFLAWVKRFAEAELGGNDGVPYPQEER